MAVDVERIALIKKECYQAAVKMVDLTTEETNFVRLHKLSTALSHVIFTAVSGHLELDDGTK